MQTCSLPAIGGHLHENMCLHNPTRYRAASTDFNSDGYFSAGFPDNDGVLNICQPLRVFSNDTLPKWAQNNTPVNDIDGDRCTYHHYTVLPIYPHTF